MTVTRVDGIIRIDLEEAEADDLVVFLEEYADEEAGNPIGTLLYETLDALLCGEEPRE